MQILYIIGNGFDLSLGMKTSYKDFFDKYKSQECQIENVKKLKKNISDYYKNWSDLELAFGQYTAEMKSLDDFDEVFEDLGENLSHYLKKEENKFKESKVDQDKFFKYLVSPEKELKQIDRNKINIYKKNFLNHHWNIDIFTFNYTTILEKIIGEDQKNINIGNHPNTNSKATVSIRSIEHIHGFADDRMVLGVNDKSQIKNNSFQENQDVLEALVKSECNKAYGHTIDDLFKEKIKAASFICIFGSSLGDTDNIWWELIGERLKDNIPLIIFTKGEEVISSRIGYKNNRTSRKVKNYFLKKTKLSDDVKQRVENNIYIGLDTSMFKDIISNSPS
jgi:hypothetical protein